jgi:hypothetical protein
MSRTHAAAMSPTHTGCTNAGSYPATTSDTCSRAASTSSTAAAAAASEQRPGSRDQ